MSRLYPIFSIEEAKAYEESILGGEPSKTAAAMENAGNAIGAAILQDYRELHEWPETPHVLVLSGKGLNAGDAYIACRRLHRAMPGLQVTIVMTSAETDLNPLAKEALEKLRKDLGQALLILSAEDFLKADHSPVDVVLDGLYGLGFRPPLREPAASLLKAINSRTDIEMRAAIDIPSGIGSEADDDAFEADFTYIPGVAKEPCFMEEHAEKIGRIRFLEIHPFLEQPCDDRKKIIASPRWFKAINQIRAAGSDKRTYGHCLILAGSSRMPGAAIMATMGCVQAGAGLATTLTPASICSHIASSVPEAMWRPLPQTPDGGLDVESVRVVNQFASKGNSLLIGPGMSTDRSTVFTICRIIRETSLALVLDASALTQDIVSSALGRSLASGPVVLTPHRGEFARLIGTGGDVGNPETLLAFCRKFRVITVLKGNPTIVCDGNRIITVPAGGPVLARGGSGDVLSGMILTQLGQNPDDPVNAVLRAVTWHGAAADSLARQSGSIAVRTTEILPHLSRSLRS